MLSGKHVSTYQVLLVLNDQQGYQADNAKYCHYSSIDVLHYNEGNANFYN